MGNRVTLPIEGMTCGACALTVQNRLQRAPGVIEATVNYATARAITTDGAPGVGAGGAVGRWYDCGQYRNSVSMASMPPGPGA
jgi:cation transport ATPase